jgi:putative nucleotidyltransferase with HDIG domain
MNSQTKAYIGFVALVGAACLFHGLRSWHCADPEKFLSYLLLAALAASVKIRLPGVMGTVSLNFVFVLLGIAEFSLSENIVMGMLCAVVQIFLHAKHRPTMPQLAFNMGNTALGIHAVYSFSQEPLFHSGLMTAAMLFVANSVPLSVVIGLTEQKNPWSVWRESFMWTFPNYLAGAAAVWVVGELNHRLGWQAGAVLVPIIYVVHRSHRTWVERLEEARRSVEQQKAHAAEVAGLHRRTIETLALAVEAKDENTREHLARVETYALEVGKELGLEGDDLQALSAAALLHDIGKLAVPEYIIAKPGKLTPDEFDTMKTHTVVGGEIVERIRFPHGVGAMVRGHHEKWNGTGYPDGLAGEQIPIGARILGAVDCLDALTSDRQYRRALPPEKAIEIMQSESGKSYDPKVVEILVRRYKELDALSRNTERIEKLPVGVRVERGDAPAAGFEKTAETATRDLEALDRAVEGTVARSESERPNAEGALTDFITFASQCGSPDALLAGLKAALPGILPYDAMVIYRRRGHTLFPWSADGDGSGVLGSAHIPGGEGLSGWVAEHGKPIVNGNPDVEAAYLQDPVRFGKLQSALAVPLITEGGIRGVMSLYRRQTNAFTGGNLATLTALGSVVATALEEASRSRT